MKTFKKLSILLIAIILSTSCVFSQDKKKLVGIWEGDATLESQPAPNTLTLTMEIKEEKLSGYISDQFGIFADTPLEEINFKNDSLSFKLAVSSPSGGSLSLLFKMKVTSDEMKGTYVIPEIKDKGTWTAARKKK